MKTKTLVSFVVAMSALLGTANTMAQTQDGAPPMPPTACPFIYWQWMASPPAGYVAYADGTCRPVNCPASTPLPLVAENLQWSHSVSICPPGKTKNLVRDPSKPITTTTATTHLNEAFCHNPDGTGNFGSYTYVESAPDCN